MLEDKIKQIQQAIETDNTLSKEEREKLLNLSEELHKELEHLEKTHSKDAHKIAEHAHKTVEKGTEESTHGLTESAQEFEVSHPNLTRIIQTLCAQFGV
jgi:vacuolar-type H+-ATPase subunit H